MIPLEQPNMPHTQPVGPTPNLKPGAGAPAYATDDENAKDAANAAARTFDFFIAHLFPDSPYATPKDISFRPIATHSKQEPHRGCEIVAPVAFTSHWRRRSRYDLT